MYRSKGLPRRVASDLIIFACGLFAAAASPPNAGTQKSAEGFAAFWAKFKAAVAHDDREAVVSMTRFPVVYKDEEHSREDFIKDYDKLFTRQIKQCIADRKPFRDGGEYVISCLPREPLGGKVIFEKDGDAYKLTTFSLDLNE